MLLLVLFNNNFVACVAVHALLSCISLSFFFMFSVFGMVVAVFIFFICLFLPFLLLFSVGEAMALVVVVLLSPDCSGFTNLPVSILLEL